MKGSEGHEKTNAPDAHPGGNAGRDGAAGDELRARVLEASIPRHYSRAGRLERAGAAVRWLHGFDPRRKASLLGALVATRGLRFVAFAVGLALLAAGGTWLAMGDGASGRLAGSSWTLSVLAYGDDALASVRRRGPGDPGADLPVSIAIGPPGGAEALRVDAFVDESAAQSFPLPLRGGADLPEVLATVRAGGGELVLRAKVR